MRRAKIALLLVAVALLVWWQGAQAQTTGKIAGRVLDAPTGAPLPAVNVVVEGTSRGAATDENGTFVILNMPPGVYTLRASMIGYEAVRLQNVRVSVNRTEEVTIRLSPTVLEGKEVVVQAERVVIKKDQTTSIRNVSSELMDILPVENVGAVIGLQAGVVEGHFRGGRLTEVAYLIDGMEVTESFGGGGRHVDLEPTAIADLEVITGTFNAEYGKAMSGVVNAVTKEGGRRLQGTISADLANFLTSHKDIFIGLRDEEITRNQDYKAQLSGPLLGERLTFLADFRYQNNKNHLNGVRRFRPSDFSNFESDNPAQWYSEHTGDSAYVPMNRSKNLSLMSKLSWRPTPDLKVGLLYTRNRDEWHDYNHAFKYNPDGMAATHRDAHMGAVQLNHMLSPRLFYELKLSALYHDHGWYVFKDPLDRRYVHDKFLRDTGPGFFTGGQQKGHDERLMREQSIKYDITWQATPRHSLKGGFQVTRYDLHNRYKEIRNLYYNTDLESQLYQPVVLPDSSIYTDLYRVKPLEFSAYVQDKMEFDEMVINLGVRYDFFDPKTVYPSQPRNPANQLIFADPSRQSTYPAADPKVQVSPRFGLSYQLGKTALLRFSYGHFFQMPPLYALYQNHDFRVAPTDFVTVMGNPQLKAEKTVQYEVGLWQELTPGMGLEVALFYRDIYDLLSAKVITTFNQIEYGLYSNKDYGNAKGLELKYDFVRGPLSAYVNYTLQYTRGNADYPTQTFDRAGNSMDPVVRLIPMSWDQRHTLNATVGYNTPRYGVTLTGYYNSGAPYSWDPLPESMLARVNLYPNNAWRPARVSVDMSSFYTIAVSSVVKLRVTLNVYNLLDRLNEVWVNSQTGRAYTAIVRPSDIAGHRSDFNDYMDRVHNPSMFVAPRLVKMGLGIMF